MEAKELGHCIQLLYDSLIKHTMGDRDHTIWDWQMESIEDENPDGARFLKALLYAWSMMDSIRPREIDRLIKYIRERESNHHVTVSFPTRTDQPSTFYMIGHYLQQERMLMEPQQRHAFPLSFGGLAAYLATRAARMHSYPLGGLSRFSGNDSLYPDYVRIISRGPSVVFEDFSNLRSENPGPPSHVVSFVRYLNRIGIRVTHVFTLVTGLITIDEFNDLVSSGKGPELAKKYLLEVF